MIELVRREGSSEYALVFSYSKHLKNSVHVLVGAILRERIPVNIYLDYNYPPSSEGLIQILRLAEKHKRVVWGITLFTTQIPKIVHGLREYLKRLPANIIPVAGGPHSTGDPLGTLKLGFKAVFLGEAEDSITEFLERLMNRDDYLKTRGLSFLEGEKLKCNPQSKTVVLDEYPPIVPEVKLYNPIEVTRGCPYNCTYCQTPRIYGNKVRHRSIESVIYWSSEMLRRGLRDLRFISPNALCYGSSSGLSVEIESLRELLIKLREKADNYGGRVFYGSFPSEIRPDFICVDTLKVLRENVDNERIIIGAQTGSNKLLRIIRRGHSIEDVYEAVIQAKKLNFRVDVDFIFGLPREEEEDVEATLKAMDELVRLGARIHAHSFIPLPGTPLWQFKPKKLGKKYKKTIYKMVGKGLAYGYWEEQEKIAEEIYKLKTKGLIVGSTCQYIL